MQLKYITNIDNKKHKKDAGHSKNLKSRGILVDTNNICRG